MKPRRRLVASFSSAGVVLLVAAAWIMFAPPQLGGQTSYVIVNGNSMEPGMRRGDLAIVRKSDSYRIGDVVTYEHPQIGPVIHRVIARDGARYVLQGDNNDFIDSYHPSEAELIGEQWIHIPKVGSWLARFRSPVYMAGLLFVAFIGLGGAAAKSQANSPTRTGRGATGGARAVRTSGDNPMNQLTRNWQDTAAVLGAAGIALFALAWVAFHRPTSVDVPANIPYTQSGEFTYSAVPADGRVYDTGLATAGEPVYRKLSEDVAFRFDYSIKANEAATTGGIYQMVAELGDANGWKRTLQLTPPTEFSGAQFSAEGVLNLGQAQELIAILEEQSGVKSDKYTLTLRPKVEVSGTIGGTPFDDVFQPELPMVLDRLQLRMDARQPAESPLEPRTDGLVQTLQPETNTVNLLALSLPVSAARVISVGGLGIVLAAAGGLLILGVQQANASRQGPMGAGRGRLRNSVVNVRGSVPAPKTRVVDVASLEDLGRIAARLGAVILQEARPGYHAFFVHDMDLTYRFEAVGSEDAAATRSAAPRKIA